jgi:hypothetical protein
MKQIFINEDQLPTSLYLSEKISVSNEYAKLVLIRFHENGLIVKNAMGNYRFVRGRYEILVKRAAFGGGREL